jgi:hypothetical protein
VPNEGVTLNLPYLDILNVLSKSEVHGLYGFLFNFSQKKKKKEIKSKYYKQTLKLLKHKFNSNKTCKRSFFFFSFFRGHKSSLLAAFGYR